MNPPRPRIQRAFLRWLGEHKDDFKARPMAPRRTDEFIYLSFHGVTAQVTAALTRSEINVEACEQGECWDLLLSLDVSPQRITDGYECSLCLPEAKTVYPSREALWRDHLFEPFFEWCNGVLANAQWLALYRAANGGTTWAKLIVDSDVEHKSDAFALIKIRQ